jgi:hypothetical protein
MRLIVGAMLYFSLSAILWYWKPRGDLWLIGSLLLTAAYMPYFLWAITQQDGHQK